jgi:hypothetical protein
MEIGLTWCGDPDAFWRWPTETQERVVQGTPASAEEAQEGVPAPRG